MTNCRLRQHHAPFGMVSSFCMKLVGPSTSNAMTSVPPPLPVDSSSCKVTSMSIMIFYRRVLCSSAMSPICCKCLSKVSSMRAKQPLPKHKARACHAAHTPEHVCARHTLTDIATLLPRCRIGKRAVSTLPSRHNVCLHSSRHGRCQCCHVAHHENISDRHTKQSSRGSTRIPVGRKAFTLSNTAPQPKQDTAD